MKKLTSYVWLAEVLFVSLTVVSCKKDKAKEVISGFTYAVDATDFKKVTFTNVSTGHTSVSWDFGDGSTSTENNPVHTYAAVGAYVVKLTATNADGSDQSQQTVTIADPNAELTKLVGATSKSWKLLRRVNGNRWPLEVGPLPQGTTVWWGLGRDNDDIALRPCTMNDEWIFGRDGSMKFKTNGDYWAEGGVFEPANECLPSSSMTGPGGTNLSAFGDGNHTYTLTIGTNPTLEVKGLGAYIGLPKIGTDSEVNTPQTSVKYDIIKLSDGNVCDTLILQSNWKFSGNTSGNDDAYWRITLVSYDNPADEPGIPDPSAQAIFQVGQDKLTVTLTNNSKYANAYMWDFGDGATSTQENPTHTYANAGEYTIKLTATSSGANATNPTATSQQTVTVTSGVILESDIVGGPWRVRKAANSVYVGPGLGNSDWWQVPLSGLDGSASGPDDWSCMVDDEFIFNANGVYEYKTNGTARNDGYMGSPQGCWSDAQIAGSGNGAAFGSGVHSFTFVPASGPSRPKLILTNGASGAAFLGFYKGYYGGENTDATKPPNGGNSTNTYEIISYLKAGGVETLVISVDISAAKDGSAAWSAVLVR
jgi:PKD repeat protein